MDSSKLLHSIIATAIDGILTIDESGKVESLNPAALDIFGYTEAEVIGQNISMLMPEPDKSKHDSYLQNHQKTGEKKIIGKGREVRGLRKDGSTFPFRLAVSEVNYGDRTIYTGFVHDLSKEKESDEMLRRYASELEDLVKERTKSLNVLIEALSAAKEEITTSLKKEKELNHMKSRFVSMASHEFRTPLSSIQLSSILIEKYATATGQTQIIKHVNKINNAVRNLTTILSDFLSLERVEMGNITPSLDSFNLLTFAKEIVEEMQLTAKVDQQIIYQHSGEEQMVKLDQNLLRNCLINLIGNAIKYSGEHTAIEFTTSISPEYYGFTVKDNGMGIPDADQKELFHPFFRAHNAGNIPGTGLGLHIVQRYAQLMGGELNFQSKLGEGAKFELIFKRQL
ncbi:PAS domain-containing sensor histidine kinase [Pedobacter sp. ASV28]|uniref:PAS domain-containing sensor histidine kinase n=1 Tax=Pedobacter sp. ASV28 TaxID=2795123 RepID=UPI0018ECA9CD|nr:PAS domain-containing sensor histidine kinase [Pedobacter sp. ASV28]